MKASNRVALVTGGSAGIGASISRHLLDAAYLVLRAERLVDVPVNLSDVDETQTAIREQASRHAITSLVHNAAVIRPALIEDVELTDVRYLARLHIHAGIALMQGTLDALKAANFGRVVIVASRALLGLAISTGYAATKAGQLGLVRAWARKLGRYGITVNAVSPGPIVTDIFTDRAGGQRTGRAACRVDTGQAAGKAGRCGARGDVSVVARQRFRYQPESVCMRRNERGIARAVRRQCQ